MGSGMTHICATKIQNITQNAKYYSKCKNITQNTKYYTKCKNIALKRQSSEKGLQLQKKFSITFPFCSVYMSVIANTQIPFAQTPQIQAANLCQMKLKAQNKLMLVNSILNA